MHEAACQQGESFYIDPDSGFQVFSAYGLNLRERCCGSGCRHCPYAHENLADEKRARLIQQASWLTPPPDLSHNSDLLFWSGGKDSFLALRALQREGNKRNLILLTTFDALERRVAHQDLTLPSIIRQAKYLQVPLLGIPLHPGREYEKAVEPAIELVRRVDRIVFGDLHLSHIREWREQAFANIATKMEARLHFPLWQADYQSLMKELEEAEIACEVSAVSDIAQDHIQIGETFDRKMMERLPASIDSFGENGEFHTLARVWDSRKHD